MSIYLPNSGADEDDGPAKLAALAVLVSEQRHHLHHLNHHHSPAHARHL